MFARKASRRILVVVIGTLIAGLAVESTVLAATLVRGGGAVTAVQTVTANDQVYVNSDSPQTMPGMSLNVTVPPGEQALLVVTFSAATLCYGTPGSYCYLRARVDGQAISPGEVIFATTPDTANAISWEANSMQFVAGPVAAGQHTIDIRWRVEMSGVSFAVYGRTLTVLSSKV